MMSQMMTKCFMKNKLSISLICLSLTFTTGCNAFNFGWEREDQKKVEEGVGEDITGIDGPTAGHFDEEGNWVPDNEAIATTYKIPDISAGFMFDVAPIIRNDKDMWSGMALPSIQVELFEFDTSIPYVGTLKFDVGVAYQRGYMYVGKLWTNIFEISTGGFVGWDWKENDISYGLGATIIKF